jgi:hypothetical protein
MLSFSSVSALTAVVCAIELSVTTNTAMATISAWVIVCINMVPGKLFLLFGINYLWFRTWHFVRQDKILKGR